MKLSEVIQKIYDTNYKSDCYVHLIRESADTLRISVECDSYSEIIKFYIRNNKIDMSNDMYLLPMKEFKRLLNEFKWLYKLWLNEVLIEDDMEE